MAVALSNSNIQKAFYHCSCFKVASLTKSILDVSDTSDLKDHYVLGEQLGWGQFGIIRECTDKLTGDLFACKSIAKDRLVTEEDVRSIKLEIEIMSKLSEHPNIVGLKAVYEEEGYVHLVMELCAGGELFNQLEKRGRYSEAEARILFKQLMQVVMYCHDNGIVHRDLKPENILLATKASSSPIKLADFGLATYIEPGKKLHGTVGSPFYIAPEVLARGYNQAADVWSAGVILYILLSGVPPFWGKTKSRIFDAVRAADLRFPSDPWDYTSRSARELIQGMLSADPLKRLTAKQVLDHSWVRDPAPLSKDLCECEKQNYGRVDLVNSSYSLMGRNQDISFGTGVSFGDSCSPIVTSRSSFSSFFSDPSSPCNEPAVFTFDDRGGSHAQQVSATIFSLPSFSFFGPGSIVEQRNCAMDLTYSRKVDAVLIEANFGKLFALPREVDKKEVNEMKDGPRGPRVPGIQSRRNHTIGLGEHEQLDLMVTESVIRWASCTYLSTTTALRSSLVC